MLNEGDPESAKNFHDPEEEDAPLASLALGLIDTFLTPRDAGQLRTTQEWLQVIQLFTYDLNEFDFSPSDAVSERPLRQARSDVLSYFGK